MYPASGEHILQVFENDRLGKHLDQRTGNWEALREKVSGLYRPPKVRKCRILRGCRHNSTCNTEISCKAMHICM